MSPPVAPVSVLVASYADMDVLDVVGPLEAFSHSRDSNGESLFKVTVAGEDPLRTGQWLVLKPNIGYEEALKDLASYDILLIPGAKPDYIYPLLNETSPIVQLINGFGEADAPKEHPRILLSVCTGAFFLSHCGIFTGRKCTTHYGFGEEFEKSLAKRSPGATYVKTSYVDAGNLDNGVNVISTGGISNGMDGGLYVAGKLFGKEVKTGAARTMDFEELQRAGISAE